MTRGYVKMAEDLTGSIGEPFRRYLQRSSNEAEAEPIEEATAIGPTSPPIGPNTVGKLQVLEIVRQFGRGSRICGNAFKR